MRLGDVCLKIGSGATPRGGKDVYLATGGVATLIRSQNIYNDRFERAGLVFLHPEHADQLENVEVRSGDILLNITGDSVARVCQVPDDVLPARVNQHVAIIRPDPEKLHPRFLRFFLASPQIQAHMLGLAAAGATRNALTKGMIEGFTVPDLPWHDQLAIATLLGALEDKIDLNRRTNDTLEAMARAIFEDWFVDFGPSRSKADGHPAYLSQDIWALFPDSVDDQDKPTGWPRTQWQTMATLEYGKRLEGYQDAIGDFPVYGTNGLIGWHTAPLSPEAGIIIGRKGAYRGVHFSELPFYVIDTAFYLKPKVAYSSRWAYYTLCRYDIDSMDSGSAIPSTSRDDFYKIELIEPPYPVQLKFDQTLNPVWAKQRTNHLESETLAELRDLLLPKLVSGEIHLKDAEKKIEEAL